MKKLSWGRLSVLVLLVSLLFTACKGKDGTNGTNGTNGANGAPGTANVMYSAWLDVTFALNTTDSLYYATITAPKLVDSILQKGTVMTYVNAGTAAAPVIFPLPYTDLVSFLFIDVAYTPGKINLSSDGNISTTTSSGSKVQQYRYVIIPGGVATGRMATVDWKNYAAVKEYLGIKD
jgi:hypothetical protein